MRSPEDTDADADAAGSDEVTDYPFSPATASQNGQDAAFGHQDNDHGYGETGPPEATARVPQYPGPVTEAGAYPEPGAEPPTAITPPVTGVAPQPWAAGDEQPWGGGDRDANRTTAIPPGPRDRYLGAPGGAARPAPGSPAAAPVTAAAARPGVQARRADLVIARLEPWSVMKFSFLMSLVAWVILFVAVAFLYFVLSSLGVFSSLQHTLGSVTSTSGSSGVNLSHWFSASRILGYTMLLGAVNIVLLTALSTVGAMIYNLVTRLGGGIEVTLRESD